MGHLYMILLLEFPSKRVSRLINPVGGRDVLRRKM